MTETITLNVPTATIESTTKQGGDFPVDFSAYVVQPTGELKGALIVIHEIWGLVDHIMSIADRYAAEGYLVVAPDVLSAIGIEAQIGEELFAIRNSPDEKVRTEGQPRLRDAFDSLQTPGYSEWVVGALGAVVDYLEAQPGIDGRVAVTGFCFGGSYSFALAAADPRVKAALPFYGSAGAAGDLSAIACPVYAFYGENDPSLIDALPDVSKQMADAGIDFQTKVYPGTGHAFFNDTNPATYDADASADAWAKANAFLAAHLG